MHIRPTSSRWQIVRTSSGEPIAAPEGQTRERGILFETKDGKYSFKVNKYKTSVSNANSGGLTNQWFISASQQWGGNWANHFEHQLDW